MFEKWYAICDNTWIFDTMIKWELSLLLYISSLTAEKGYCYAGNEHLATKFRSHETTISRKIKKLEKAGYIKIEYKYRGSEITMRKIRLAKMLTDHKQKCQPTVSKNAKDNITSNNITSNNKEKINQKETEICITTETNIFKTMDNERIMKKYEISPQELEDEIEFFTNHWTAPVRNGKVADIGKQLWETKETFEPNRRFATWLGNNKKWNKRTLQHKPTWIWIVE